MDALGDADRVGDELREPDRLPVPQGDAEGLRDAEAVAQPSGGGRCSG